MESDLEIRYRECHAKIKKLSQDLSAEQSKLVRLEKMTKCQHSFKEDYVGKHTCIKCGYVVTY